MRIHARLAAASGAAALGVAVMLLLERFEGTVATLVIATVAARAAGPASMLSSGVVSAAVSRAALRRQAAFAVAWVLAGAAASVRAGSAILSDVAGAHAVGGLSIARGPLLTVVGCWASLAACAIAVGGSGGMLAVSAGRVSAPAVASRMSMLSAAVQVAAAAALFAGPQVRSFRDAIPWALTALGVVVFARRFRDAASTDRAAVVAGALAAAGLLLILAGGRP